MRQSKRRFSNNENKALELIKSLDNSGNSRPLLGITKQIVRTQLDRNRARTGFDFSFIFKIDKTQSALSIHKTRGRKLNQIEMVKGKKWENRRIPLIIMLWASNRFLKDQYTLYCCV